MSITVIIETYFRTVNFGYILSQRRDQVLKKDLSTILTKNKSKNNYSKIYFYFDCNRPKRDLKKYMLQACKY